MKKLLLLSLSVLLAFTLASCSMSGANSEQDTNPSEINRYISLDNDVTLYVGENRA